VFLIRPAAAKLVRFIDLIFIALGSVFDRWL
jgi:hypothetical protein